ncbi:MAG: sel1 repeat family protein [Gammaproteobacteria bacterium]|nr:sel1 repeat family protein [Gammaproteobacteria bacterium]
MKKLLQITAITLLFLGITSCATTQNPIQVGKQAFTSGDYTTAYQQLYPEAVKGDPNAEYAVGYMLYYGKGVAKDQSAGANWIREAAVHGQAQAEAALKLLTEQAMLDMSSNVPPTN